ncbi:hypothetical protein F5Y15DRAFT_137378 [Xylariaceae sp. FL0016]|nr:hypothetical protein F5Y15DRAFT_137378 [Xylariaceae sp. FL0016]
MSSATKPTVLHIGDPVKYNFELWERFSSEFNVIRPSLEDRQRGPFLQALKDRKWGDFVAVFRPFWNTGGEMGRWDKELIPLLPKSMRIYASAGAGFDWADTDIMAENGILYCNGGPAPAEAVADMAIFHIISVFRNITWSALAARSGDPAQWAEAHKFVPVGSHNPRNHVIGIIGLGNIGYLIAKKAHACFGAKIHYHDIIRKSAEQEGLVQATYHDKLDDLLSVSDCVVLATPFGGEALINSERLAKFKKGSRFVNIARGTLVDENALVEALKSGHIFAAGLDVFQDEPNVHPELVKMRSVMLTSHNAGGAEETRHGFERLAMENIESLLLKGKALTPVNAHLMKTE